MNNEKAADIFSSSLYTNFDITRVRMTLHEFPPAKSKPLLITAFLRDFRRVRHGHQVRQTEEQVPVVSSVH